MAIKICLDCDKFYSTKIRTSKRCLICKNFNIENKKRRHPTCEFNPQLIYNNRDNLKTLLTTRY